MTDRKLARCSCNCSRRLLTCPGACAAAAHAQCCSFKPQAAATCSAATLPRAHRLRSSGLHGHGKGMVCPARAACKGHGGSGASRRVGAGGGRHSGRPSPAAAAAPPAGLTCLCIGAEQPCAGQAAPNPRKRRHSAVLEELCLCYSPPVWPPSHSPTDAGARSVESRAQHPDWAPLRQAAPARWPPQHAATGGRASEPFMSHAACTRVRCGLHHGARYSVSIVRPRHSMFASSAPRLAAACRLPAVAPLRLLVTQVKVVTINGPCGRDHVLNMSAICASMPQSTTAASPGEE